MPSLTVKQEAFCQAYIENGGNASDAYRTAYSASKMQATTINRNAKFLLDDNKIATRIATLRSAIQKRHELTIDDIIAELEEARELAKNATVPNPGVMVNATMGKAKVAGLIKDKAEITGVDGGPVDVSLKVSFVSPG